ncbi:hypothetical protein NMY22_g18995 [Coprinellus aureogranulatus]|nr:hypothetical protein NMY22_g18995 [Coprinellus aureogranulatus]
MSGPTIPISVQATPLPPLEPSLGPGTAIDAFSRPQRRLSAISLPPKPSIPHPPRCDVGNVVDVRICAQASKNSGTREQQDARRARRCNRVLGAARAKWRASDYLGHVKPYSFDTVTLRTFHGGHAGPSSKGELAAAYRGGLYSSILEDPQPSKVVYGIAAYAKLMKSLKENLDSEATSSSLKKGWMMAIAGKSTRGKEGPSMRFLMSRDLDCMAMCDGGLVDIVSGEPLLWLRAADAAALLPLRYVQPTPDLNMH